MTCTFFLDTGTKGYKVALSTQQREHIMQEQLNKISAHDRQHIANSSYPDRAKNLIAMLLRLKKSDPARDAIIDFCYKAIKKA